MRFRCESNNQIILLLCFVCPQSSNQINARHNTTHSNREANNKQRRQLYNITTNNDRMDNDNMKTTTIIPDVDPLFNGRRKFKGAVYVIVATQELQRRLHLRAKHAAVFATAAQIARYKKEQKDKENLERQRGSKARHAAVFATVSDSMNKKTDEPDIVIPPLLYDVSFNAKRHFVDIQPAVVTLRDVGTKFNPRRTFRAAVIAVVAAHELQRRTELVRNVKETLGWLGQHINSYQPSLAFVQQFYKDCNFYVEDFDEEEEEKKKLSPVEQELAQINARRKFRAAVYTVMASHKLQMMAEEWHEENLIADSTEERKADDVSFLSFDPKRAFRAAAYAALFNNELWKACKTGKGEEDEFDLNELMADKYFEKKRHQREPPESLLHPHHHPHEHPHHHVEFDLHDSATFVKEHRHDEHFAEKRKAIGDTVVPAMFHLNSKKHLPQKPFLKKSMSAE